MVGRISIQQTRVFAMFAVAFVMTGLCSTYAHTANNTLALMTGGLALVLIIAMFSEAQKTK